MDIQDRLAALAASLPRGSEFRWESGQGDSLHFAWLGIPVRARGKGAATRFLAEVLAATDSAGISTTLDADPTLEPGDPTLADLVVLYWRMGYRFVEITPDYWVTMDRPAREPVPAGTLLLEWEAARGSVPSVEDVCDWANRVMGGEARAPFPGTPAPPRPWMPAP